MVIEFSPALWAHVLSLAPPSRLPVDAAELSLPSNRTAGAASSACRSREDSARCRACGLKVPRARPKRYEFMHQARNMAMLLWVETIQIRSIWVARWGSREVPLVLHIRSRLSSVCPSNWCLVATISTCCESLKSDGRPMMTKEPLECGNCVEKWQVRTTIADKKKSKPRRG